MVWEQYREHRGNTAGLAHAESLIFRGFPQTDPFTPRHRPTVSFPYRTFTPSKATGRNRRHHRGLRHATRPHHRGIKTPTARETADQPAFASRRTPHTKVSGIPPDCSCPETHPSLPHPPDPTPWRPARPIGRPESSSGEPSGCRKTHGNPSSVITACAGTLRRRHR